MTNKDESPRQLLLSIRPIFARAILAGHKGVELRRVRPAVGPGDEIVVYETSPTSAVVGMATVNRVECASPRVLWTRHGAVSGLTRSEFLEYFRGRDVGYGIVLADVRILDEPVSLQAIRRLVPKFHPPQSYHYLSDERLADRRLVACL